MINYTKDKGGCLIFATLDIDKLKLNNCVAIQDNKSTYVFPFDILNQFIDKYRYRHFNYYPSIDDFMQDKKGLLYLKGQKHEKNYHYACKNKHNFLTGNCDKGYTCKGFKVADNLPFSWNRSILKYIDPIYCDKNYKGRRTLFYTDLNPDTRTIKKTKHTLSMRGKRAGITRKLNFKCGECIYAEVCADKYNHAKENCRVSRKMANRVMRKVAEERFGSYKKLLELMRYVGVIHNRKTDENKSKVLCPLTKNLMVIRDYDNGYTRWSLNKVKQRFKPQEINNDLEKRAKTIIFLLSVIEPKESEILCPAIKNYKDYTIIDIIKNSQTYCSDIDSFNDYKDVIQYVGKRKKKALFHNETRC